MITVWTLMVMCIGILVLTFGAGFALNRHANVQSEIVASLWAGFGLLLLGLGFPAIVMLMIFTIEK